MVPIWTLDEETVKLGNENFGGVTVEDGFHDRRDTVRVLGSTHNLEGNVTAVDEIVGQPDGRKTAISKLVDHLVAISLGVDLAELVTKVDWVEAIPQVFLEVLDKIQVGRRVFGLSSHVGGREGERLQTRRIDHQMFGIGRVTGLHQGFSQLKSTQIEQISDLKLNANMTRNKPNLLVKQFRFG